MVLNLRPHPPREGLVYQYTAAKYVPDLLFIYKTGIYNFLSDVFIQVAKVFHAVQCAIPYTIERFRTALRNTFESKTTGCYCSGMLSAFLISW
jgi:hypothetical protein